MRMNEPRKINKHADIYGKISRHHINEGRLLGGKELNIEDIFSYTILSCVPEHGVSCCL